jgi:hypothetical protein
MKYAQLGSISHGTLRDEDLLDAFASELEYHVQRNADEWCSDEGRAERNRLLKLVTEAQDMLSPSEDVETLDENASELVNELNDELNAFAPPYCYFGNTEGDGSDFGFWPCMEQIEELPRITDMIRRGWCAADSIEAPPLADQARELGEDCAYVNDHGNVRVYGGDGSILLELV